MSPTTSISQSRCAALTTVPGRGLRESRKDRLALGRDSAAPIRGRIDQANALAKQNGAVGVFFSGIVGSLTLNNPHFYPIYAEAKSSVCRSACTPAKARRHLLDFFDLELNGTFAASHLPPIIGFRDLVAGEIPEKFPALKFGFLEVSASWVPFLYHHLKRSARPRPSLSQRALETRLVQRPVPRLPHLCCLRSRRRYPLPGGVHRRRSSADRLRLRPQRSGGGKSLGRDDADAAKICQAD